MTVQSQRRFEHPRQWTPERALPAAAEASATGRWRIIGLTLLGLFLLYHVVTKSFGAYLADADPEAALLLNGNNPTALLNLAEDKLSKDPSFGLLDPVLAPPRNAGPGSTVPKGDDTVPTDVQTEVPAATRSTLDQATLDEIRGLAERALAQDPLNARAFRILGQISEHTSDEMQTQQLMQAAVRRSLLESIAVYWMMRKSFQDQNYKEALRYADILMRTRPQALGPIMPIMGKMAELPEASADLKSLLSTNPPWRPQFLSSVPNAISDARTPLDILLSLKDTANPPTAKDLRPYLDFLIQHGFYDLAYYTWLQFLSPDQLVQAANLYNGGFDAVPSGTPFDWVLTKGTGVTVQVAAKSDKPGERALFLQFGPGRVDYREVTELIMLSPGSYQFHGKYKGDLVSERGLEWRVVCAAKEQNVIGRRLVSRSTTAQWQDLEFSFTVPQADCPAQYVKLVFDARSASERFISGNIWFDDFKIAREEPPVATQPTPAPAAPLGTPQPAEASGSTAAPPPQASEAPAASAEPTVAPAPPPETVQPAAPSGTPAATGPSPQSSEAPAAPAAPGVTSAPPQAAAPPSSPQ